MPVAVMETLHQFSNGQLRQAIRLIRAGYRVRSATWEAIKAEVHARAFDDELNSFATLLVLTRLQDFAEAV